MERVFFGKFHHRLTGALGFKRPSRAIFIVPSVGFIAHFVVQVVFYRSGPEPVAPGRVSFRGFFFFKTPVLHQLGLQPPIAAMVDFLEEYPVHRCRHLCSFLRQVDNYGTFGFLLCAAGQENQGARNDKQMLCHRQGIFMMNLPNWRTLVTDRTKSGQEGKTARAQTILVVMQMINLLIYNGLAEIIRYCSGTFYFRSTSPPAPIAVNIRNWSLMLCGWQMGC